MRLVRWLGMVFALQRPRCLTNWAGRQTLLKLSLRMLHRAASGLHTTAPPILTTDGACCRRGQIILIPSKREPPVADIVYRLFDD